MIAILDYGMGNLRSVEKALERVGRPAEVTRDLDRIRAADALLLPGVGAFPRAMAEIRRLELDRVLHERVDAGVPVLGICLGMQLLFDGSEELGGAEGLGLLPGRVKRLDSCGLKLPQIGWNAVAWTDGSPLHRGLADPCPFYHVHTFAPRPSDPGVVLGTATYGGEFVSAVGRGNVLGVQFHPEKSGRDGLRLLANFGP